MKKFKELPWLIKKWHLFVGNVIKTRVVKHYSSKYYEAQGFSRSVSSADCYWRYEGYYENIDEAVARCQHLQQLWYESYLNRDPKPVWSSK